MPKSFHHPIISLLLVLLLFSSTVWCVPFVPVTGDQLDSLEPVIVKSRSLPDLSAFISQVWNGDENQVTGLYVPSRLALPVVQQPDNMPGYVSAIPEVVTQFSLALEFGSLGFLAHNYLAGSKFFTMIPDDIIYVVYGDGHYAKYGISEVRRFQALQPGSVLSDFLDLTTHQELTASELFHQTYGIEGNLILQTCISYGQHDSWGRLFIIATPLISPPDDDRHLLTRWLQ